jgi:hypothetical protein
MAGFAAHAIIRYRLLDIRVVIKSGVVYASGIAVAVSLFVGITSLLRLVTGDRTDSISLTAAVAIAVVTAVLFQPLNTSLQTYSTAIYTAGATTSNGPCEIQAGTSAQSSTRRSCCTFSSTQSKES